MQEDWSDVTPISTVLEGGVCQIKHTYECMANTLVLFLFRQKIG